MGHSVGRGPAAGSARPPGGAPGAGAPGGPAGDGDGPPVCVHRNGAGGGASTQLDLSAYVDPIARGRQKGTGLAIYKAHFVTSQEANGEPIDDADSDTKEDQFDNCDLESSGSGSSQGGPST